MSQRVTFILACLTQLDRIIGQGEARFCVDPFLPKPVDLLDAVTASHTHLLQFQQQASNL
jgi:hypothetical protein